MTASLFGTDGIRGKAGTYPIVPEIAYALGMAFALVSKGKRFLIAMDTRESSPGLAGAAAAGFRAVDTSPVLGGTLPTPVLAHCINSLGYGGGLMVTASHNPFNDNGLKLFGPDGHKLSDSMQHAVEQALLNLQPEKLHLPDYPCTVSAESQNTFLDSYLDHLSSLGILPDSGTELPSVDCANGAATSLFDRLNEKLPTPLSLINAKPDGRNINLRCGAAQPDHIKPETAALDGDGDRIILKDEKGRIINGDHLLMFLADRLATTGVVGTVMTNQAVEKHCMGNGIPFSRTEVGDRHIRYRMDENGSNLGGETSGHLIYDPINPTGDGAAIYLLTLHLMGRESLRLSDLVDRYALMPQALVNIPVQKKIPFSDIPGFRQLLEQAETIVVPETGRVYPRYSGTENLLRILIESTSESINDSVAAMFSEFFQSRRT